jgi:hypothetical protein
VRGTLFDPAIGGLRDVTRQAKGLYCLKYIVALKSGLAYLSWCNSGWFCHTSNVFSINKHKKQLCDLLV